MIGRPASASCARSPFAPTRTAASWTPARRATPRIASGATSSPVRSRRSSTARASASSGRAPASAAPSSSLRDCESQSRTTTRRTGRALPLISTARLVLIKADTPGLLAGCHGARRGAPESGGTSPLVVLSDALRNKHPKVHRPRAVPPTERERNASVPAALALHPTRRRAVYAVVAGATTLCPAGSGLFKSDHYRLGLPTGAPSLRSPARAYTPAGSRGPVSPSSPRP